MRPAAALLMFIVLAGHDGGVAPSRAEPPADRPDERASLSLEQAADIVKRRFDARVVRAEEVRDGAEVIYRIRLLAADGRVFTVRVNARSGAVE